MFRSRIFTSTNRERSSGRINCSCKAGCRRAEANVVCLLRAELCEQRHFGREQFSFESSKFYAGLRQGVVRYSQPILFGRIHWAAVGIAPEPVPDCEFRRAVQRDFEPGFDWQFAIESAAVVFNRCAGRRDHRCSGIWEFQYLAGCEWDTDSRKRVYRAEPFHAEPAACKDV